MSTLTFDFSKLSNKLTVMCLMDKITPWNFMHQVITLQGGPPHLNLYRAYGYNISDVCLHNLPNIR